MSKKTIKGEDGKTYVVKEPNTSKWYKRWYTWVGAVVLVAVISGGAVAYHSHQEAEQASNVTAVLKSSSSESENSSSSEDTNSEQTSDSDTNDGEKDIELSDGTNVHVKESQAFSANYGDTSYHGADLEATNVTVGKTKSFTYDDIDNGNTTEHGYIAIKTKYTAGSDDMTLYDDQAVLNTSDGQQINIDAEDSNLIGDVNAGATKKATLVFMIPDISKTDQFTSLRLKVDAAPQDDDSADMHTYDGTFKISAN